MAVFDISIPTVEDPSLAPTGSHQLTALVHYLRANRRMGRTAGTDQLIEQLSHYAPGRRQS